MSRAYGTIASLTTPDQRVVIASYAFTLCITSLASISPVRLPRSLTWVPVASQQLGLARRAQATTRLVSLQHAQQAEGSAVDQLESLSSTFPDDLDEHDLRVARLVLAGAERIPS